MLLVASSELSFRKTETPIRTILLGRSSSFDPRYTEPLLKKIRNHDSFRLPGRL